MNTLFYYSHSAQDRMLPRIHAQSLNHSRESRYVSGAGGMVVRKSSGRCVAHLEEGWSQENPWGLLASSLAIKGKHGPRFRERPVRKEQVESDQSTEASWQSCMQTGAGTCGRASSSRHRPNCSSGKTQYIPGLPVPSNKCRPKVSGKFSHKKLKEWF